MLISLPEGGLHEAFGQLQEPCWGWAVSQANQVQIQLEKLIKTGSEDELDIFIGCFKNGFLAFRHFN